MERYKGTLSIFYRGKLRKIPYSYFVSSGDPEFVIDDKNGHSYHFRLLWGKWEPCGGLTGLIPEDMKEMLYEKFEEIFANK